MKVVIIPKKPIPGILPKNKWIDSKMVLDLNKNEIKHCMQFGNVYDESGNLIDAISIKNISDRKSTEKVVSESNTENKIPEKPSAEPLEKQNIQKEPVKEEIKEEEPVVEPAVVEEPVIEEEPVEDPVPEEEPVIEEEVDTEAPYYNLQVLSCNKEDEYIVLTAMMDTNDKLEGNLYGLFNVIAGAKPTSIEYKNADNWVKFGSKFASFESISNGDTYTFRFIPKDGSEFAFRILIKEGNNEVSKLEAKLNPSKM